MNVPNPIFCAIDTNDLARAEQLAQQLKGHVGGLKLGLEFFLAHGREGYRKLAASGVPIFLDLKLHDIPNTVAGAVTSLLSLAPDFMTLHAGGGGSMMKAAATTAAKAAKHPRLLAVTVLTSMDADDLAGVGQEANLAAQVQRLAKLAQGSGMDGVICSPEEVATLRKTCGADFILMVPGIRPSWTAAHDQKRVMTPREAMQAGATYLVIGRPITGADDPAAAADRIMEEMRA